MPKKPAPTVAKADTKITKAIEKKSKGHFNIKKVAVGEFFSGCQYLKVLSIKGDMVKL